VPVLIIEDDEGIREMLQWALEDAGVPVETVEDGAQALQWIEARRPSLVLLDFGLPLVSGVGVAERLRSLYGSHVPIIAMSADMHAREKAHASEVLTFFEKPFDILMLVHTVTAVLCAT
jgi:DNA-binding response OmpR family regulator